MMPDDTDALSEAGDAINQGIRRLNMHVWRWQLTFQDITLDNTNDEYDLQAAFKSEFKMQRLNSDSEADGTLEYKDEKTFFLEHQRLTTSGSPRVYTVPGPHQRGKVRLERVPASGFTSSWPTLRFWYYARIQKLVDNADQLDAPHEAEEFVAWYAKWVMATTHDQSKIRVAERCWRDAEHELLLDNRRNHDWSENYVTRQSA